MGRVGAAVKHPPSRRRLEDTAARGRPRARGAHDSPAGRGLRGQVRRRAHPRHQPPGQVHRRRRPPRPHPPTRRRPRQTPLPRLRTADWIHIHLGLFGKVTFGDAPAPPPTDTVRLRLANATSYVDLRGPTTCAPSRTTRSRRYTPASARTPSRADADPCGGVPPRLPQPYDDRRPPHGREDHRGRRERLPRRSPLPTRHRSASAREDITPAQWDAIWTDLAALMRGASATTASTPSARNTPRRSWAGPPRVDDHGGEVYVYRRADLPCHICGGEIRTADLAARNLFWCPTCQNGCTRVALPGLQPGAATRARPPTRSPPRPPRARPAALSHPPRRRERDQGHPCRDTPPPTPVRTARDQRRPTYAHRSRPWCPR